MYDFDNVSPGASSVEVHNVLERPALTTVAAALPPVITGTRAPHVPHAYVRHKGSAPRKFSAGRMYSDFEPGVSSLQRQAEWEKRYDRTWSKFCVFCTALAVVVVAVAWAGLQVSHAPHDQHR